MHVYLALRRNARRKNDLQLSDSANNNHVSVLFIETEKYLLYRLYKNIELNVQGKTMNVLCVSCLNQVFRGLKKQSTSNIFFPVSSFLFYLSPIPTHVTETTADPSLLSAFFLSRCSVWFPAS